MTNGTKTVFAQGAYTPKICSVFVRYIKKLCSSVPND